jgi:hypothetical protein
MCRLGSVAVALNNGDVGPLDEERVSDAGAHAAAAEHTHILGNF